MRRASATRPHWRSSKASPGPTTSLNHWLDDPQVYAPGTRMTFAGIKNDQQRADVIDYLRTLSQHPGAVARA